MCVCLWGVFLLLCLCCVAYVIMCCLVRDCCCLCVVCLCTRVYMYKYICICVVSVVHVMLLWLCLLGVRLLGAVFFLGRCLDCSGSKSDSAYYMTVNEYTNVAGCCSLLLLLLVFFGGLWL